VKNSLLAIAIMIFVLSACSAGGTLLTTPTDTYASNPIETPFIPSVTLEPSTTPGNPGFGPEAVWNIDGNIGNYQNCFNNQSSSINCVITLMHSSGASPQATAFTKLLQGTAYMSSFTEFGFVDLAQITYPVRANNNVQYILINGNPQIVYVEDVNKVDITHDPNYPTLKQKYPNLQIEGGENKFVSMKPLSQSGQRFIFSCALVDGCHACQIDNYANIAFDFDDTGQFEGMKLVNIN
jgi:hypothetical protein